MYNNVIVTESYTNLHAMARKMLFFISGIIACFRYSQAFFILADNPDMSPLECIRQSKNMMRGNKGYLFGLNISFIGWALLATFTSGILSNLAYDSLPFDNVIVFTLIQLPILLPVYLVFAYVEITNGLFYEFASGDLRPISNSTSAIFL